MRYTMLKRTQADAIVAFWNETIGADFPLRKRLLLQNSLDDPNVLANGSLLAIDERGRIAGLVIAKKYGEPIDVGMNPAIGWIQTLLVRRDCRRRGIGSRLLTSAEQALATRGATKILLGKDVRHYFPGIPQQYAETRQWFAQKGYRFAGIEYDLLTETAVRAMPKVAGGSFLLAAHGDNRRQLLDFLHRCFPGRWEYEAMNYYTAGGSGREFVILKKAGKIVGFCRINDRQSPQIGPNVYWAPLFPDGLGGIGPLGLDRAERGKGSGLALVRAGIAYLNRRGYTCVAIDWTQLVDFYQKVGAHPWKAYATYSKQLKS
ncbi:MAG: GNAT family N-acetyltransferase [Sporolactobacillus sp.]|nr:GNAT family N-acetyltransferase [Sporolactobacillus sp.]